MHLFAVKSDFKFWLPSPQKLLKTCSASATEPPHSDAADTPRVKPAPNHRLVFLHLSPPLEPDSSESAFERNFQIPFPALLAVLSGRSKLSSATTTRYGNVVAIISIVAQFTSNFLSFQLSVCMMGDLGLNNIQDFLLSSCCVGHWPEDFARVASLNSHSEALSWEYYCNFTLRVINMKHSGRPAKAVGQGWKGVEVNQQNLTPESHL